MALVESDEKINLKQEAEEKINLKQKEIKKLEKKEQALINQIQEKKEYLFSRNIIRKKDKIKKLEKKEQAFINQIQGEKEYLASGGTSKKDVLKKLCQSENPFHFFCVLIFSTTENFPKFHFFLKNEPQNQKFESQNVVCQFFSDFYFFLAS